LHNAHSSQDAAEVTRGTGLAAVARSPYLDKIAPGLAKLLRCQRVDLSHDIIAGLSVAAVALPVGVVYAELAAFGPAVGLYSRLLPLLAFAVFGTSRQVIVVPDAATCALVSAAVTPLAAGNQDLYQSLSVALVLLAGVLCIGASFLKLGAPADYLSKPLRVGFLTKKIPVYVDLCEVIRIYKTEKALALSTK